MQIETLRREQEKAQAREHIHAGKQPLSPIEQVRLSSSVPVRALLVAQLDKRRLHQRTSVSISMHICHAQAEKPSTAARIGLLK